MSVPTLNSSVMRPCESAALGGQLRDAFDALELLLLLDDDFLLDFLRAGARPARLIVMIGVCTSGVSCIGIRTAQRGRTARRATRRR